MTEVTMHPTYTTSTTGTLRVPPATPAFPPPPAGATPTPPPSVPPPTHPSPTPAPEPLRAAQAPAPLPTHPAPASGFGPLRAAPGPAPAPADPAPASGFGPLRAAPGPVPAPADSAPAPAPGPLRAAQAPVPPPTHAAPAPVSEPLRAAPAPASAAFGPRRDPWPPVLAPDRAAEPPGGPAPAAAAPAPASDQAAEPPVAPAPVPFAPPRAPWAPAQAGVEPRPPVPAPDRAAESLGAPGPAVTGFASPRAQAASAPAGAGSGSAHAHPVDPRTPAGPGRFRGVGAPREPGTSGAADETSTGWATAPTALLEVPPARARAESEPVQPYAEIPHPQGEEQAVPAPVDTLRLRTADEESAIPHPQDPEPAGPAPAPEPWPDLELDREPDPEPDLDLEPDLALPDPEAPHPGVPGPGVAELVARAVARGLEPRQGTAADAPDVPRGPHRGTAVTEVPVHLPFRGAAKPPASPAPAEPAARTAPAGPRPAPGRRVPPGDERLREHRGPVLPGWIGVGIGGLALAGCAAVLWRAGAVPATIVAAFGGTPRAYHGLRATHWPPLAFLGIVALLALGGLGRARSGHAWVLTLFGRYRGTVRRTGLTWVSPLLLRRRVDVRLRHWRSEPMPAVDSGGLALQVVVQVVWQVKDTARATLAVADHVDYLAEQVESAMARVLSQLPADAFHEDAPTLRDAEAVGDALTRMVAAETEAVGIEVFSAQPTRIEYAAEVAEAMRRRRVAAIDAKHRDTVLSSVVDAVDDTVHRLTSRGLVELDDYERKALVKDLTVAFYTGRAE
ncbi:SPFH domain-containing protein [Streptomyces sp. NPDC057010]|uniref:SPFH domain-containing protein n=1 Tax=Streptomyces sp. NPDC057010 TaxID=3345997 RepID=UPI0036321C33